jgi:hypothetical protein
MKIRLQVIFTLFLVLGCYVSLAQGTWVKTTNYPGVSNTNPKTFTIGSKIYVRSDVEHNGVTVTTGQSFWQYDTATGTWAQLANFAGGPKHNFVSFSINNKGYIGLGGDTIGISSSKLFWEYDPALNTWNKIANFPGSPGYIDAAFSIASKGYLYDRDKTLWEYDPSTGNWAQKTPCPAGTPNMTFAIGNKAYGVVGKLLYEYDPATDKWTKKTNFGGVARAGAVAFSIGGKGYVGLGNDEYGNPVKDFWVYNQSLDIWAKVADFPGINRFFTRSAGIGAKGYVLFGSNQYSIDDLNDVWAYTPDNLSEQKILSPDTVIKKFTDPDFDFVATSSSGLPTTFSVLDAPIGSVVNNKIHITGIGKTLIVVKLAGNSSYRESTDKSTLFIVTKVPQTITLPQITQKTYGDTDIDPGATSTSGLRVNYSSSNTAVAIISNGKIHITGAGTTTIKALQAGEGYYDVAPDVSQTLTVSKANQVITFPEIITKNLGSADFDPGAVSSSNLPVSYSSGAAIVDGKLHLISAGSYIVTASQAGDNNYNAATSVTRTFTVLFALPANNFQISTTSVSCKGQNNGAITINATQNLNYTAVITGNGLNKSNTFTTDVSFATLTAGTYNVCITVNGQADYKQCFDLVITEPKDLSAYVSIGKDERTVTLQLNGADNYNINLNGTTYHATESQITLPIGNSSNKLIVSTDKLCQGTIEQIINKSGNLIPYPNPFKDVLYINLGESVVATAVVKVYNLINGNLVQSALYNNKSGVAQLDLSKLNNGIYSLTLSLDQTESVFKIIKK